jgi:hypothetical protein
VPQPAAVQTGIVLPPGEGEEHDGNARHDPRRDRSESER